MSNRLLFTSEPQDPVHTLSSTRWSWTDQTELDKRVNIRSNNPDCVSLLLHHLFIQELTNVLVATTTQLKVPLLLIQH